VAAVERAKKPRDWRLLLLVLSQIASPSNWGNARLLAREQARHAKANPDAAEARVDAHRRQHGTPEGLWSLPSLRVVLSLNADFKPLGISRASHDLLAERIRLFGPQTAEE